MALKKETKKDGIITWKNIEKSSISFGIVVNIIIILIAFQKYIPFKITNSLFFVIITFFTELLSIFIIIGYFFHYLFYIKVLKEIKFEEILTKIKKYFIITLIILMIVTIYFLNKIIETFSINNLDNFILTLSIYLVNYSLVFISITSLFFYLITEKISKIFLEPLLKTIFLTMNAIIIIFFLNVLMTITALKNKNFSFLGIVFISNLSLIYALIKVSKEYFQRIENL